MKQLDLESGKQIQNEEHVCTGTRVSTFEGLWEYVRKLLIRWRTTHPVLPHVFVRSKDLEFDELRARRAINLLVRMSMISESSKVECYSMHPLVHIWVRKRASYAEQALWSQVAANVLASSIKLPPLQDEQDDVDYYISIVPHLRSVALIQQDIQTRIRERKNSAQVWHAIFSSSANRLSSIDALNLARYSRAFMQAGDFAKAEELQSVVQEFVCLHLPRDDEKSIQAYLLLSKTKWHLGKGNEAAEIQRELVDICSRSKRLGPHHTMTLKLKNELGDSYWQLGNFKAAKALHKYVITVLEGSETMTCDLYKAKDCLGRVAAKYFEYQAAVSLHIEALRGLTRLVGHDDLDTMRAKDSLATTLLDIGGIFNLHAAKTLMGQVLTGRVKRLGKEHPYTLWARANLARCNAALGALTNNKKLLNRAIADLQAALIIATRNLGSDSFGTLFGRQHLANTYRLNAEYDKAEVELREVMTLQASVPHAKAGASPDKIATMEFLILCLQDQGRHAECLKLCEQIFSDLEILEAREHPVWASTEEKEKELRRLCTQHHD